MGEHKGHRSDSPEAAADTRLFLLLILLVIGVLTFFPLFGAGLTTNDDMLLHLDAVTDKGLLSRSLYWAKQNGRFHVFFQQILIKVPYLFESFAYYKAVSLAPIALDIVLFSIVVRQFAGPFLVPALTATVFMAFLTNMWDHYILTSYPFLYTTGIAFLLLSFILFFKGFRSPGRLYSIGGPACFFFALLTYEVFLGYFAVFFLVPLYRAIAEGGGIRGAIRDAARRCLPYAYPVVIYLVAYFTFRHFFPPDYIGSKVGGFSTERFMRVVFQFSMSSLPTYVYYNYQYYLSPYSMAYEGYSQGLGHILRNVRVEWVAKAALTASIVFFVLRSRPAVFVLRSYAAICLTAVGLFFMPPILPALTEQYQRFVESGIIAHTVTYFSLFGTVLFAVATLVYINQLLSRNCVLSLIYAIIVALGLATASLVTDYTNWHVSFSQAQSALKWSTFNRFLGTDEFRAVPEGSLVYAPSLWDKIGFVGIHDSYWTDYVRARTGKEVAFINNRGLMGKAMGPEGGPSVYYLKYSQERKDPDQFIVFSRIRNIGPDGRLFSDNAYLFTYSRYKQFLLFLTTSGGRGTAGQEKVYVDDALSFADNGFHAVLVNKEGEREPFVKTVVLARQLALENISISNYTDFAIRKIFELNWGGGCHGLEGDTRYNWRWSGPNCELSVFNGSGREVSLTLSMNFATGYKDLSNLKVDSSLFSDNLKVNSEGVEYKRVVKVPPGRYAIRFSSDAPRVEATSDTRGLVFNIRNFKAI